MTAPALRAAVLLALTAGMAPAQDAAGGATGAPSRPEAAAPAVTEASAVFLRGLDKVSGQTTDIEIPVGGSGRYGPLEVAVSSCRYPVDDPASNAYAHLTIRDPAQAAPLFDGWMIASSPALNALDHPRYDLWVLRCKSS